MLKNIYFVGFVVSKNYCGCLKFDNSRDFASMSWLALVELF